MGHQPTNLRAATSGRCSLQANPRETIASRFQQRVLGSDQLRVFKHDSLYRLQLGTAHRMRLTRGEPQPFGYPGCTMPQFDGDGALPIRVEGTLRTYGSNHQRERTRLVEHRYAKCVHAWNGPTNRPRHFSLPYFS